MKYSLLCGSLSRPNLPLLKWAKDPEILVEPQELALYRDAHPELKFHVLPKSGGGFSYMMNQMVNTCLKNGHRYFVFTDDDVFGLKSRALISEKFSRLTPETSEAVLSAIVEQASREGLAQFIISFSGASWGATKAYQEPAGAWGVYVCDAMAAKAVGGFDESLTIFSDWDMTAKLLKAGYRCVKTNLVTFEHKMRGMSGGAEHLYKQQEKIKASAETLAARYGKDCAKVQWVEAHQQFEVRFNWRKLNG